jgi:hypothetical protein
MRDQALVRQGHSTLAFSREVAGLVQRFLLTERFA